jgi:predicted dinucleotide-binding enzyme
MKIGIVGAGNMGAALGTLWSCKGHQVMYSYSRDSEKLKKLSQLNRNTSSGTVEEAVLFGDVVMLAVPFTALEEIMEKKKTFANKIIITCVSGLQPDFTGTTIGLPAKYKLSVAEHISLALPSAKVVEAFNTTFAELLRLPRRQLDGVKPSLFYCGDDLAAKKLVAGLIEDCDYIAINAGNLHTARTMETFATSWVQFAVVAGLFPRMGFHSLHY